MVSQRSLQLWLVLACHICFSSEAKKLSRTLRIGGPKNNTWRYLTKFGFDVGDGSVQVRVKLVSPRTIKNENVVLAIAGFFEVDWPTVENNVCDERASALKSMSLSIDPMGNWSSWVNTSLHQTQKPHLWYFVVHDCDGSLDSFSHRFQVEFHATQDDSEFSFEMRGVFFVNVTYFLMFSVYIYYIFRRSIVLARSYLHPVIWAQIITLAMQYFAQVAYTLHLWRYHANGWGVKAFEVIAFICGMLGQVLQAEILIMIALGYTLVQSRVGDLDVAIPVFMLVVVFHAVVVGIGKIRDDSAYVYHENEGVCGWLLMIMRILLYGWFVWAIQSTAAEGGVRLAGFCKQFRALGTLYFLAYPTTFLITKQFSDHWQYCAMSLGMMIFQIGSNLWFGFLFLGQSSYFKVSSLSDSLLPGGTKVGFIKDE